MDMQTPLNSPYNSLSGWIAISAETDINKLNEKVNLGLNSFIDGYGSLKFIKVREKFGFGFLKPVKILPMSTWSFCENEYSICFIEGVFYNDYYNHRIKDGCDIDFSEKILRKFSEEKYKSIDKISGSFSGFIYDKKNRIITSFIDKLGSKLVYWSYSNSELVISSSLLVFSKVKNVSLDRCALFQSITIGFPIGERTLLDGVKIQPPSSVMIFNGSSRKLERYWQVPQRLKHMVPRDAAEFINASMEGFVDRIYERTQSAIALGMTGGHDSRIIFSALQCRNIPFECIRWDEGNFNDKVVRELCSLVKKELITVEPISSNAEILEIRKNTFLYSDGNYIYPSGFSRLAIESYKRGFAILMIGFGGDRISGGLTIPAPRYVKSIKELSRVALNNQMELLNFKDAIRIIECADEEMYRETLKEWYMSFSEENLENFEDFAIWQCINNRNLKRIRYYMNPMLKYIQAIYPYSDNDILHVYLSLPLKLINHQKAHCYAGFYRNREYANYQAVQYPISLKNEYRYSLSLYMMRLMKNKLSNINFMRNSKKQNIAPSEWDSSIMKELGTFEIFNVKSLRDLHLRGLVSQSILRKMHTLKIFYDFFVCRKDITELLSHSSSQQEK